MRKLDTITRSGLRREKVGKKVKKRRGGLTGWEQLRLTLRQKIWLALHLNVMDGVTK